MLSSKTISSKQSALRSPLPTRDHYEKFDVLDGTHDWQKAVPEGAVLYPVRELNFGKVIYFNFNLAKEMGLLPTHHPHKLNASLNKKIIKTFSLRIINEFDQKNGTPYPPGAVKPNRYMATRYLQLQHSNRRGQTSGDGRGLWNGQITHAGVTWDVSSRGTGVTSLAPGAVESGKHLKTGSTEFGYGCGLAELDELLACALQSEIFHNQGIKTERVLCIIDHGQGLGIGVRAGPNLLRPAHLFPYLKQGQWPQLQRAVHYYLHRESKNKGRKQPHPTDLKEWFIKVQEDFGEFAGRLEAEYIFTWLDWDGDNVLAQAGIIDYGSIRQLGLRHDRYRYDDVQRYSTNLAEQKMKAQQIVQTFAQLVDFLKTGRKQRIEAFNKSKYFKSFQKKFNWSRQNAYFQRLGFQGSLEQLSPTQQLAFNSVFKEFKYFETAKVSGGLTEVSDGINQAPLFNPFKIFDKILDAKTQDHSNSQWLEQVLKSSFSSFARKKDRIVKSSHKQHLVSWIRSLEPLLSVENARAVQKRLRARNFENRITGNALIHVTDSLLSIYKKSQSPEKIQILVDELIRRYSHTDSNTPFRPHLKLVKWADELSQLEEIICSQQEEI